MYRPFRLSSGADFRRAREHGSPFRDRFLVVLVRRNDGSQSRFGFVTSGKIGGAVQRNSVRRLLREAARSTVPDLAASYDIVVIATRQAVGANFNRISESLGALLRRAGVVHPQG